MYINYTHVNAAWDSAFWQWLVTITKSFTSLVSRLVGFFMRRLQTTSVKSHAWKKSRVGYFLSLSIDQIKMHQRRNWLLTCDWRREGGAVLRHRKKCTQPCTVIFFFFNLSTNLTFSVFTLKRVSDMTNIYCQKKIYMWKRRLLGDERRRICFLRRERGYWTELKAQAN